MNKSESKYFNTAVRMDRALISLLEKKDLEYITVSEICREAGVNRSTFYLHYETIGDLLEETTRYLLDDFLSCFSVEHKQIADRFQACGLGELNFITEQYLTPYLCYMRDNRKVFAVAMSNAAALGFNDVFRNLYRYVFDPILARFHYPEAHRPYVMRFYLQGITAVVAEWLKNGCDQSVEEIIAVIRECIFGREHSLLEVVEESGRSEE